MQGHTRDDIGPYMRQYAEEYNILKKARRMLVGSYRGDKMLLATKLFADKKSYVTHDLDLVFVDVVTRHFPQEIRCNGATKRN